MKYWQITVARLRNLGAKWRPTLRRYCGAPPAGFGVVHMTAESNGEATPTVRDRRRRPIGIMQVPWRIGQRHGRSLEELEDTTINIYTWAIQTNRDADYIHTTYPNDWTTANLDFWLAVRLYWIVGQTVFDRLYSNARADGTAYQTSQGLISWIRTKMPQGAHYGRHTYKDLQGKAAHLEAFKKGLIFVEGNFTTKSFTEPPTITPGNTLKARAIGATI